MPMPFQVISEDPYSFTVQDNATGQTQQIARSGLTPETQASLSQNYQAGIASTPMPVPTNAVDVNAPPPLPAPIATPDQAMNIMQGIQPPAAPTMPPPVMDQAAVPKGRRWDIATPVAPIADISFDGESPTARTQASLDTLMKNEKGIIGELSKNQQEQGRQALGIVEERNKKLAEHQAMVQENETKRAAELDKFYTDINKDISEIGRGIDPDRYWKKDGGSNKITAILSMALGAVGQAFLRSNQNVGIDLVMKQIEQDIDAQKEELAGKRTQAGFKTNMLGQLREKYGDERVAENVLRQGYLDQAMQKLEVLTQNSENKNATLKGADLYEQLRVKAIPYQLQIDAMKVEEMKAKAAGATAGKDLTVPNVGQAYDQETARKARTVKQTFDSMSTQLGRLIKERATGVGAEQLDRAKIAQLKGISAGLKLDLKEMASLGALSGADLKIIESQIPSDPTAVGQVMPKLLEAYNYIKNKTNAYMANNIKGYTGIQSIAPTWEKEEWAQKVLNAE